MFKNARHTAILRQLRLRGTVATDELAAELGVSVVSIRRDLRELEQRDQLRRVHGGATVPRSSARAEGALDVAAFGLDPSSTRPEAPLAVVGMVVPASQYYFAEVVRGASHAARVAGVQLILGVTHYAQKREVDMARHMVKLGVDALIFTPANHDITLPGVHELLMQPPVPIVLMERDPGAAITEVDSVRTDHALGAEMAVRHLHGQGRRRIALMTIPNATEPQLRQGFARTAADLEMATPDVDPGLSEAARQKWAHDPDLFADQYLDLLLEAEVDGLVVNPDMHAVTFARALVARGVAVPDRIAIVAYDDEVANLCEVPMSIVAPPKFGVGTNALALALQRIRPVAEGQRRATVRTTLIPELKQHGATHAVGALP